MDQNMDQKMETINWDEFAKSFKFFGLDRMTFFMQDKEALAILRQAPEEIRRDAYTKCKKFNIAWPEDIAVDTTGLSDDGNLFVSDAKPGDAAKNSQGNEQGPLQPPKPDDPPPGPQGHYFSCNRYPNYTIFVGKKAAQFVKGKLITDDPEIIKAVLKDPWYNVHIFGEE